ncbi:hypothetical protein [Nonomuraea rosea]
MLIEAATQLKNTGGIEDVLGRLDDAPYRDGDRVEGVRSFVISMPRPGG